MSNGQHFLVSSDKERSIPTAPIPSKYLTVSVFLRTMNYKATATLQWILVFGAGIASLHFGKAYSRVQATEMATHYEGATTRDDISTAITAHNESIKN